MSVSPSRVVVVQPALPSYRLPFFEAVAARLSGEFVVYASPGGLGVLTEHARPPAWYRQLGPLRAVAPGVEWQVGALPIEVSRHDVLVVNGNPRQLSTMALLVRARLRGARTVWWGHLWSATTARHRFIIRLWLMRLAHAVVFYTDEEVKSYRMTSYGRRDRRLVAALNNGIDVAPIDKVRVGYDPARRPKRVFFIGRITEKAELQVLLHAMATPELVDVGLDVVGDGPLRERFASLAERLGIGQRVAWHRATTDEATVASVANRCLAFCYPGGVGLSLIHAMAYGLPAVLHDDRLTHMPEIAAFQEGVTGYSFEKGDPVSLAARLARLLDDHEAMARMSAVALDRVHATYNTNAMADRFVEAVSRWP